jgi:aspartate aminotransferase-like enzyme
MPVPRNILLNPGPCTTSERVKQALVMPDLCPRERAFGDLLARVRGKLLATVHAEGTHTAVLFAGAGTLAVEAALSSLVGPSDQLLVIDNGAYGERAAQIARAHARPHRVLRLAWGEFPALPAIAAALDASPRADH